MNDNVVVLAGGTGGAKFVRGIACCVPPEKLTIIVNTGDDVTMQGLRISPDVDIIVYTLAGLVAPDRGWGFAGDTFHCIEQLRGYGREGWFNLGDRDLATHLLRTQLLTEGQSPSQVTSAICEALGVAQRVLPMTDQTVETHVQLAGGALLHFQEYLIRDGAPEDVDSVIFQNIGAALPAAGVLEAIAEADVLLIAPSSPVVSIGTILSVAGMFDAIQATAARAVAVSPLASGAPISGPSAQLMRAFGIEVSNIGLCDAYGPLIEQLVIHESDAADAAAIEERGLHVLVLDTMMPDMQNSRRVARAVLEAVDYPVVDIPPPALADTSPLAPPAAPQLAGETAEAEELRVRIADLESAHQEAAAAQSATEAEAAAARSAQEAQAEAAKEQSAKLVAVLELVSVLEDDVAQITAERDELRNSLADAEDQAATQDEAQAQETADQTAELEQTVAEITAKLDSARTREDKLEFAFSEEADTLETVRAELAAQSAALEAERAQAAERQSDAAGAAADMEGRLGAQEAAMRAAAEEYRARLAKFETDLRDVRASRERARQRRKVDREKARDLIGRMREEILKARTLAKEQRILAQEREEKQTAEAERDGRQDRAREQLRATIAQLEKQLRNTGAELDAATATIAASEARVTKLQEQVTSLARGDRGASRPPPAPPPLPDLPPLPATPVPTVPSAVAPAKVEMPPEPLQGTPDSDTESMAQRARRRGRSPD